MWRIALVILTSCHLVFPLNEKAPGLDAPGDSTCPGVDLANDPRNCGTCGHDCGGEGVCDEGACQPQVFADRQGGASHLALTGTHLFWNASVDGAIRRRLTALETTAEETLLENVMHANDVRVLFPDLFYTADDGIFGCGTEGCNASPTLWTTCPNAPSGEVALTSTLVLSTCPSSQTVQKATRAGPESTPFATTRSGLGAIVADDTGVFWVETTNGGQIAHRPIVNDNITGGESLIPAVGATRLALTLDNVVWISPTTNEIQAARRAGLALRTIADTQDTLTGLTIHGTDLYWVGGGSNGYLRTCALPDCGTPVDLLTELSDPVDVAVDDNFYYVIVGASGEQTILRLRRAP
jgi:hypothetical protein